MSDTIRLGRVLGFPLAVHWSVLVLLWLFTWSLAGNLLPEAAPGHRSGTYWLVGLAGATTLMASLLAHELAHALVARRCGVGVTGVTLWLFGGVATLKDEARSPGADLRIAVVGPATSIALALGFGLLAVLSDAVLGADLVLAVAWWLAVVNLLLGIFNLIPGAPLDGGRILRAYLWRRHGDRLRAAAGAARAGRAVAFALIGVGLLEIAAGAGVGGVWSIFLGWFLFMAARAEEDEVVRRQTLGDVRVADVMSRDPRGVARSCTIAEFVADHLLGDRHSAYPVLGPQGRVEGLVTLSQLRAVPADRRRDTTVGAVAIPLVSVPTAGPGDPLLEVLRRSTPLTGGRSLVFDSGRLVGIVTPTDVARLVEIKALAPTAHADPLTGQGPTAPGG
jgi:Zn-dependent protease/CBS domain-containing protein